MPSQILTKYIADTSIPAEKRRNIATMVNEGKMSEAAAVQGITTKYGEKYGKPEDTSTSGKAADFVKGVVNSQPANVIDAAEIAATKLAPAIGKSLVEKGKTVTEEDKASFAAYDAEHASDTQRLSDATQKLNAMGIVPDASKNLGEREDAIQQLKNIDTNRYASMGGGEFGRGVAEGALETMLNTSRAPGKMAKDITDMITGPDKVRDAMEADTDKVQEDLTTPKTAMEGFGKTAERVGEFMLPGAAVNKAANVVKGASWMAKLPKTTQTLLNFGTRVGLDAGAAGLVATAQEGEVNQDVANTALVAGAFSAGSQILGGIKNALFKKPNLQKELLRNGMKEQSVNVLKKLTPEQNKIAAQYIDDGLNRLENAEAPRVFQRPADEIDDFMKNVDDLRSEKGALVGKLKEPLIGKTVEFPERTKLWLDTKETLKGYNAVNPKGVLQLERSDLARTPEVVSFIDDVKNALGSSSKTAPLTYRDLESLNKQAGSLIQKLGSDGVSTSDPAVRVLRALKDSLDDTVSNLSPELKAAKQEFSALATLQDQVSSASKVKVGPGQYANDNKLILEGILQKRDMKWQEALNAMDDIEKKFGIPAPKDLTTKAHLAEIAENLTGSNQSRSMQGIVENLPGKIGKAADAFNTLKQHIAPTEQIKSQATKILNILEKSVENGKTAKLKPADAMKLGDILKAYVISLPTSGSDAPK